MQTSKNTEIVEQFASGKAIQSKRYQVIIKIENSIVMSFEYGEWVKNHNYLPPIGAEDWIIYSP